MNKKKYRKLEAVVGSRRYIIEEDKPEVGWYLYVYENDVCIYDYLQNTLARAKGFTEKKFSVPQEKWKEI